MKINKLLCDKYHESTVDRIKYIVIHYTGGVGDAEATAKYFKNSKVQSSAHYTVGFDGTIWQSVEDKNSAWHCGSNGKPYYHAECRNANSIGIEMCVKTKGGTSATSKDWYFEDATVQATIELTKSLMEKYNVPADHVLRHYDVTHKICPNPYVYNHTKHTWDDFKASLETPQGSQSGWKKIDGKWYYYHAGGVMAKDEWIHDAHHWYRIGADGVMLTGWHQIPDSKGVPSWCYFEDSGAEWHERSDGVGFLELWTTND